MTQVQAVSPQYQVAPALQPNYNAVKIDINNPSVNAPGYTQNPVQAQPPAAPITAPMYNYPQAQVYEMPQQSIYQPKSPESAPKEEQKAPQVPAPVIITPVVDTKASQTAAPVAPVAPVTTKAPEAAPQKVEVKTPEAAKPSVDINGFIAKLTGADYEQQATAMETIAEMAQNQPQKATELLDVKVVDTLLGIMQKDTSKLAGPTPQQLQIREKIMAGKQVSPAETAEANKITPMEQAERNKQYAIYTVAILQKLYGSEVEKMSKSTVPMTELPGAAGIVDQVKKNPNPMVRASAIDALSYIQCPEYKQDLTTLFTVAKKDQDTNVQQAATKALEKLAQVPDASAKVASAAPAQAAPSTPSAPAKAEVKPEAKKA